MNSKFWALFASLLWGIQPVIYKYFLNKMNKNLFIIIIGLFYLFSLTCFFLLNINEIVREYQQITNESILIIGITSIFTVFIANIIFINCLKNENSVLITALISTYPIYTILLSYYLLNEKITARMIMGIVMICIGVIIVLT